MSDVSAIQGWMSNVQSTMADFGSQMAAAAPTGDFAAVLSEVQSVLSAGPSPAASGASTSTSTSAGAAGSGAAGSAATLSATGNLLATSPLATSPLSTSPLATSPLSTSTAGVPSTTTGSAVVATAEKYLGVPYVWGGTTPSGFDCSGFTQYVYDQLGVSLPRTSEEQATVGAAVPSLADAQPGDLVFFAGSDGTPSSPGHVGIYIGNGEMVDAPETGEDVSVQPVGDPVAIRRVLPGADAASTAATVTGAAGASAGAGTVATTAAAATAATTAAATAPAVTTAGGPATGTTVLVTDVPAATTAAAPASASGATAGTAAGTSGSGVEVPASLGPLFEQAASQYGVPATLLAAVAQVESGFDPNAVSSAGAEGIMQLLPSTAAGLGVDPNDPAQAIDGAAQLLAGYLDQYHSTPMALAAYNAGPAAVATYGGVPPYAETQSYVQDVIQIAGGAS